jgi:hypothetical protein
MDAAANPDRPTAAGPLDSSLQGVEWRAAPRRRQADQRIPGMSGVPESRTSTVSNIARLNNPLRIFGETAVEYLRK